MTSREAPPGVDLADFVPDTVARKAPQARAPKGLDVRGRAFWRETVQEYDLSGPERALLEQVCRLMDYVQMLHDAVRADGVTVEGSKGQVRTHPAMVELRQQQVVLGRLLSQLALPDEDGETIPSLTQARARKAANALWRKRRG